MRFLTEILERKRVEVAERRERHGDEELEQRLHASGAMPNLASRPFFDALSAASGETRIIAEVKRASPSVGTIDADVDAPTLAKHYEAAGAAAVSILTDGPGFNGSLEDLHAARAQVKLPLLRKDFIVDRYQLLEAKLNGADVVLLIVAALSTPALHALHAEAEELGLEVLVEVHDEKELERAAHCGARVIGINNRNLATFEVSLETTERLFPRLPAGTKGVAESGVKGVEEVRRLRQCGASNFLIGEALVRAPSAEELLKQLRSVR